MHTMGLPPVVRDQQAGWYARMKEDIKSFHSKVKVSKSVKRFQRYSHFKIRQVNLKFLLLSSPPFAHSLSTYRV